MSDWYYAHAGERRGPLSRDRMRELVAAGTIADDTLVWTAGMAGWSPAAAVAELKAATVPPTSPRPPAPPAAAPPADAPADFVARVSTSIGGLTGTDRIDRAQVGGLFSQVFRRHHETEAEQVFTAGLSTTTPALAAIDATTPRPWVYSRLLLFFGVAFLALWLTWREYLNPNLIPGIILIGSFASPLATAIFFYESNVARNVSLFTFAKLFIWGGILALTLSLALFEFTEFAGETIGPPIAGLVEEPGKLAAVVLLAAATRYRWTINGMCLGAAAGAGFAAFESAGYAMMFLLEGDDGDMLAVITQRGLLAPLAHVVWTAIAAGALWRVMRGRPFSWSFLADRRCYAPLVAVMVLHATWNSALPAMLPFLLGYLALGAVAWIIAIGMMLGAMREIRTEQAAG